MTEYHEQKQVAHYLDGNGLLWCHVPNEGQHHVSYRQKMKLAGLKSGVPDILIFTRPKVIKFAGKVGLAIELKRDKGGKLSKNQRKWLNDLSAQGWVTAVCHGAHAAIGLIIEVYQTR